MGPLSALRSALSQSGELGWPLRLRWRRWRCWEQGGEEQHESWLWSAGLLSGRGWPGEPAPPPELAPRGESAPPAELRLGWAPPAEALVAGVRVEWRQQRDWWEDATGARGPRHRTELLQVGPGWTRRWLAPPALDALRPPPPEEALPQVALPPGPGLWDAAAARGLLARLAPCFVARPGAPLWGRQGERLSRAPLELDDDPAVPGSSRSRPWDDAGAPCQRQRLIEAGRLIGLLGAGRASGDPGQPLGVAPGNWILRSSAPWTEARLAEACRVRVERWSGSGCVGWWRDRRVRFSVPPALSLLSAVAAAGETGALCSGLAAPRLRIVWRG